MKEKTLGISKDVVDNWIWEDTDIWRSVGSCPKCRAESIANYSTDNFLGIGWERPFNLPTFTLIIQVFPWDKQLSVLSLFS